MSTLFYGDVRLAMYIDNVRRIDGVTSGRLNNEAESWGSRIKASEIVVDILAAVPEAVDRAADETPGAPPNIPEIVIAQLSRLSAPET
jgi:deoxyhypusine synthase